MISPVLFAVRGRPNSELSLTLVTQSPDVSDDNKIPSCFDLPVVPHKSVCLPSFFLLLSFSIPCVCFFVWEEQKGLAAFCFIYLDRSHLSPWASDGLRCVCCLNLLQGWNINTVHGKSNLSESAYVRLICSPWRNRSWAYCSDYNRKCWPSLFPKYTVTERITHKSLSSKAVHQGAKPDNKPV